MAFETTKDVLDHAREFHSQLSAFYAQLVDKIDDRRVKMLLEHMSEREKQLEADLKEFEDGAPDKVLKTWFQYTPPKGIMASCKHLVGDVAPQLSLDEVVEMSLKLDECLKQVYEGMIRGSEVEEIKAVFINLLELETQDKMELVRDTQQLKDI